MARYSAGALAAGAGSTTLPIGALVGGSTGGGRLREVGITNTTDTSCALKLVRLTGAGTPGSGLVEDKHDQGLSGPVMTAVNTYTSTGPTLGNDCGYRAVIAAAKGAGVTWVMGDAGLVIPAVANAAIGIIVENGTGQIVQYYFVWDE